MRLAAASAAEANDRWQNIKGGHSVGDCDVPRSTETIEAWNKSDNIGPFVVRLHY